MLDAKNSLKAYKDHFDKLKADRAVFDRHFQIVGEYVSMNKQNFDAGHSPGEFLSDEIFDSTGVFAAHSAASSLLGMLWPGTAKQSIELSPPDDLEQTKETAFFYERCTDRLCRAMDDHNANLSISLAEYMQDQMIFGTSGVGVTRGDISKLDFQPYGVKELYIDEGKGGRVSELYLFYSWPVSRVIAEYGVDAVSEKTKQKHEQGKAFDIVKILVCIKPRAEKEADEGALAMPYESVHMEYDSCHLLKKSGFSDLPIKVGRFKKLNYEKYGRSPAMDALPDIKEANTLKEAVSLATEKNLDPPLGVMNDAILGSGVIDTSARSISVFDATAGGGNPVFPLVTVGSLTDALSRLEDLKQTISQHFFLDRLLDFNNEAQMTFGEAQIRAQIRNASLAGLFARQISEVFTPLIARCFDILMQMGEFGVIKGSEQEQELILQGKKIEYIPDVIAERMLAGEDVYNISYKTQAASAQRSEEYIAIIDVLGFGIQAMQIDPSVRHRINLHQGVKEIASIRGLPVGIVRQDDEVKKLEDADKQAAAAQEAAQIMQTGAGIVDSLASANKAARL